MKRAGDLYDAVCEPENLRIAYCKAKRGKEGRADVLDFSRHFDENLEAIRQRLLRETPRLGDYRYFTVHDPKKRTICAAAFPERVLHHAVMNVCDPVFERHQIFDSYATRRGKGTFAAIDRARRFTEQAPWFLKLDVKKYFDSIDHAVMKSLLCRLFKDGKILRLFDRIIDSYETAPEKGVPIGNLTSQYFANYYLSTADHFIKESLRVRWYVRYMDDMVLWGADRKTLAAHLREVETFLKERLCLELKPPCLNRTDQGVPFLGFRIFPNRTLLRPASRRRFRVKIKQLMKWHDCGMIDDDEFGLRAQTLSAHVAHADTRGFRRAVLAFIIVSVIF